MSKHVVCGQPLVVFVLGLMLGRNMCAELEATGWFRLTGSLKARGKASLDLAPGDSILGVIA